jgi:hypothetical protein
MYGPIYYGTIFFYFLEKYLKKFFVLPRLPSNEKNSSDHHNSHNKGPNLAFFSFTESPSNSLLTIKFPKNHITSSYHRYLPKTTNDIFVCQRALGVKSYGVLKISTTLQAGSQPLSMQQFLPKTAKICLKTKL